MLTSFQAATDCFQITSFNEQPLHLKHATNKTVRLRHLPISPSLPHPDSGQLLEIDGDALPKNSYVKIEQVRVCTHQDIRPWSGRKLKPDSYMLLMRYAPPKPRDADEYPVRKQSRRPRHYVALKRPPSVQKLPNGYPAAVDRTLCPTNHPPRQHHIRNMRTNPLQKPLLPTHHQTTVARYAPHQRTYRTFRPLDRTSSNLIMPLRPPTSARSKRGSLQACAVIVLVCLGLLAIAAVAFSRVA
jgi:hypothetical protein